MADVVPDGSATGSQATGDLASMFSRLLVLTEKQNEMIEDQGKTQKDQTEILKTHTKMLDALEKDATKDDKAYEERGLKDEQTWGALDKEALAKIRVTVDGWRDLMNVSLIFIALFLTVVTAFISPIIQFFSTPPADASSTKPPLPATSTQLVALFYYLALMTSIFNSVMCVLGMQWAGRLLAVPLGKTNFERTLNRERRKVLAERRLVPLMSLLFWTLLLSIGFFVVGFLLQFWALAFSFRSQAPILIIGAVLSTALAVVILGIILATTYHAAVHDNSPFESALSSAMRSMLQLINNARRGREGGGKDEKRTWKSRTINGLTTILQHFLGRLLRRSAPALTSKKILATQDAQDKNKDREEDPTAVLLREEAGDKENVQALKAYARLVMSTNDTEVLERVVPSFAFNEWCIAGDQFFPVFVAVRERFLATDTSFRVKETVQKQLIYCNGWKGWRDEWGWRWRDDMSANEMTRWCKDQCEELMDGSCGSHREFFPSWVFFTSFEEDNEDLRSDFSFPESYEECVARVLCSFDQNRKVGDRSDIFRSAVNDCKSLLRDGKSEDVTLILSDNRTSFVKSVVRNPRLGWEFFKDLAKLITAGNEVAILDEIAEFLSNLPKMRTVGIRSELLVIEFLASLIPSLPVDFIVPPTLDLSSTLTLLNKHHLKKFFNWMRYSDTLMYYLDHGGFETLSTMRAAHEFLQYCIDQSPCIHSASEATCIRARFYLQAYHARFTALPGLSDSDCSALTAALEAFTNGNESDAIEDGFLDAVKECNSLVQDGKGDDVKNILSHVDLHALLGILIQNMHIRWQHISSLVLLITQGKELESLNALTPIIVNVPLLDRSDSDLPVIEFLASIIPSHPSDFVVYDKFDLSRTLTLLMRRGPDQRTWRKYSDTLIYYLDHGAFDTLSDSDAVRKFLGYYCLEGSYEMRRWWDPDERTNESTRVRAKHFMQKLDARNAASRSPQSSSDTERNAIELNALDPPNFDNPPRQPGENPIRPAFSRKLRSPWRRNRTAKADVDADVELALRPSSSVQPIVDVL